MSDIVEQIRPLLQARVGKERKKLNLKLYSAFTVFCRWFFTNNSENHLNFVIVYDNIYTDHFCGG